MSNSSDPSPPHQDGSSPLAPFADNAQFFADLDAILREYDLTHALVVGPHEAVGRLQQELHVPEPVPPAPPPAAPAFVGGYSYLLDHHFAAGPRGRKPASSRRGRNGARVRTPELIELRQNLLALSPGDPSAVTLRHQLALRSRSAEKHFLLDSKFFQFRLHDRIRLSS